MRATDLGLSLIPLGAFWTLFSALMDAGSFANGIRDSVVIGRIDGVLLTLPHRQSMFLDWQLTMCGIIAGALLFGAIIIWMSLHIRRHAAKRSLWLVTFLVGVFPLAVAGLFATCAVSDYRLIIAVLS